MKLLLSKTLKPICSLLGDLAHVLDGWSNKRKNGPIYEWYSTIAMFLVTIKFAILTDWLDNWSNKSNKNNLGEEDNGIDKENMV